MVKQLFDGQTFSMVLTETEISILNQIELFQKDYNMLSSYQLNYWHIFKPGLSYIPIQYLSNNTFGFPFRVVKEKFYMQLAYSNKNRKFYMNDQIKFNFAQTFE